MTGEAKVTRPFFRAEARWAIPIVLAAALPAAIPFPYLRLRFGLLHGAAFALLAFVVWSWVRRETARRWTAVFATVAMAAVCAAFLLYIPAKRLPTAWLTVLHQGSEANNIRQLYGQAVHAGQNFSFVSALFSSGTSSLRDVVRMNLWLGALNLIAFYAIVSQRLRKLTALGWTLLLLSPAGLYACFSELSANLTPLYFLVGVVAWTGLGEAPSRIERGAAYALLTVLTVLMAATRPEMALFGVLALVLGVGPGIVQPERWDSWSTGTTEALRRTIGWLGRHKIVLLVLCILAPRMGELADGTGGWLISTLHPFDTSFVNLFTLPPFLLLPLGFLVFLLLGLVYGFRQFRALAGLPLAVLVVFRACFSAQNGFYELLRYTCSLFPMILLLATYGVEALDALLERTSSPERWRPVAGVLVVMTWCVLPVAGAADRFVSESLRSEPRFYKLLLDRDTQREVRFLTDLVEQNPSCVFVARVVHGHGDPRHDPTWDLVAFGRTVPEPVQVSEGGETPEQFAASVAPGASCLRLYTGLDCQFEGRDDSAGFVSGRPLLNEWRFQSRVFNAPEEYGAYRLDIQLRLYEGGSLPPASRPPLTSDTNR